MHPRRKSRAATAVRGRLLAPGAADGHAAATARVRVSAHLGAAMAVPDLHHAAATDQARVNNAHLDAMTASPGLRHATPDLTGRSVEKYL